MNSSLVDEVKLNLKSALVSAPRALSVIELQKDYRKLIGSDIPYKQLGFNGIYAFLYSCDDILKIHGAGLHARVTLVDAGKSSHIRHMIDDFTMNRGKRGHKNNKNRKLPQFKPNESNAPAPIKPTWSPSEPKAEAGQLPKAATTNESHCNQHGETLVGMDYSLPEGLDIHPSMWNICLPKGVLKLGQKIPQAMIQAGQVVKVAVFEVESPHSFYVQLTEDDYSMRDMHHWMKAYYEREEDGLVFPAALLHSGQPCVVRHHRGYFRAEIIRSVDAGDANEQKFQVRLVDFGTKMVVEARHIKFLMKNFARQPKQCIQACLAGISSLASPCPREYRENLLKMVGMKALRAEIVQIDDTGKVHVTLKIEEGTNSATTSK